MSRPVQPVPPATNTAELCPPSVVRSKQRNAATPVEAMPRNRNPQDRAIDSNSAEGKNLNPSAPPHIRCRCLIQVFGLSMKVWQSNNPPGRRRRAASFRT